LQESLELKWRIENLWSLAVSEGKISERERVMANEARSMSSDALLNQGRLYERLGDMYKAREWFEKAVSRGDINAELAAQHIAQMTGSVTSATRSVADAKNGSGQRGTVDLYAELRAKAQSGDVQAMFELAQRLDNVNFDMFPPRRTESRPHVALREEAYQLHLKAAKKGDPKSMFALFFLLNQEGKENFEITKMNLKRSRSLAMSWLTRAKKAGSPQALFYSLVHEGIVGKNERELEQIIRGYLRVMQMVGRGHPYYDAAKDRADDAMRELENDKRSEARYLAEREDERAKRQEALRADMAAGMRQGLQDFSQDVSGIMGSVASNSVFSTGERLAAGAVQSVAQGIAGNSASGTSTGASGWRIKFHPEYIAYLTDIYQTIGKPMPSIFGSNGLSVAKYSSEAQARKWIDDNFAPSSRNEGGLVVSSDANMDALYRQGKIGTPVESD
jgi:TPR repeat protein